MDTLFTRLEEASHAGDVNLLKELLKIDKLLLEKVTGRTSRRDNPLHIAAMLGHADFVREVIYRKPALAKELNSQGLSALHLAAAHGHVTVVKESLKTSLDLCLLSETREGLLPLHVPVQKRRTAIITELVEACEEAVHGLTYGGETILHLAVKYNSFDTVQFLIDRVHDLNAKDNRGNTVLHHAMATKQLPVIKLLLSKPINVNSMNLVSLTPLDVLFESQPQNGDLFLGEMIRAAGGKTAAELLFERQPDIRISVPSDSSNPLSIPRTPLQQRHCHNRKKEKKKEKNHDPKILLLVATLVATVTFQAALNPPGGVQPDDKDHKDTKGQPVLAGSLNFFQVFTMFSLFSSVSVMMLLLCAVPRKKKIVMRFLVLVIWGAAFSMGLAFTAGIDALYNYKVYYNYNYINDNSTSHNTTNTIDYQKYQADIWYLVPFLIYGWFFLLRLSISWVVVQFMIFLVKKTGLWQPVPQRFALLKRGCFLKWQQFTNITKINWSNCCQLFKKIICFVLILSALASISFLWVSYMYTRASVARVSHNHRRSD